VLVTLRVVTELSLTFFYTTLCSINAHKVWYDADTLCYVMGDFETLDDWTDEQQQYAAGIVLYCYMYQ